MTSDNEIAVSLDAGGKRFALVMGNANYRHADALNNPLNDAASIARVLTNVGFEVKHLPDGDLPAMAQAFRLFLERIRDADMALLYYSGHAMQMHGENYLLPVEVRVIEPQGVGLGMFALSEQMAAMKSAAKVSICILDACRDNPFELDALMGSGLLRRVVVPPTGLHDVSLDRRDGQSLVAFSAAPGETAEDGPPDGLSYFTEALVRLIPVQGLEIHDLMRLVKARVQEATDFRQQPHSTDSLTAKFFFVPPVEPDAEMREDRDITSSPKTFLDKAATLPSTMPAWVALAVSLIGLVASMALPYAIEREIDVRRLLLLGVVFAALSAVAVLLPRLRGAVGGIALGIGVMPSLLTTLEAILPTALPAQWIVYVLSGGLGAACGIALGSFPTGAGNRYTLASTVLATTLLGAGWAMPWDAPCGGSNHCPTVVADVVDRIGDIDAEASTLRNAVYDEARLLLQASQIDEDDKLRLVTALLRLAAPHAIDGLRPEGRTTLVSLLASVEVGLWASPAWAEAKSSARLLIARLDANAVTPQGQDGLGAIRRVLIGEPGGGPISLNFSNSEYGGGVSRSQANETWDLLRRLGWKMAEEGTNGSRETTSAADDVNEVRFFDDKDASAAELLASDLRVAGVPTSASNGTGTGPVEVWISTPPIQDTWSEQGSPSSAWCFQRFGANDSMQYSLRCHKSHTLCLKLAGDSHGGTEKSSCKFVAYLDQSDPGLSSGGAEDSFYLYSKTPFGLPFPPVGTAATSAATVP